MADHSRLDLLSNLNLIDLLAKEYSYTHEEVVHLSAGFVMEIMFLKKEQSEFNSRLSEAFKTISKHKKE